MLTDKLNFRKLELLVFILGMVFLSLNIQAQLVSDQFLLISPEFHGQPNYKKTRSIAGSKSKVQNKKNSQKKPGVSTSETQNITISEPDQNSVVDQSKGKTKVDTNSTNENTISIDLYCGFGFYKAGSSSENGALSSNNNDCGLRTNIWSNKDFGIKVQYSSIFNFKIPDIGPIEKNVNASREVLEFSIESGLCSNYIYSLGYYYENYRFPISSSGRIGQLIKGLSLGFQNEIYKNQVSSIDLNILGVPILSHSQSDGSNAISIGTANYGQLIFLGVEGFYKTKEKESLIIRINYKNANLPSSSINQKISEFNLDFGYRFSY